MGNVVYSKKSVVSHDDIGALLKESLSKENISRICYHESDDSKLHLMLIQMPPEKNYPMHRHLDSDESLVLVNGDLYITLLDDCSGSNEVMHLRKMDSNSDGLALLVKQNQWHAVASGSDGAVFLEIKRGPFDKSMVEFGE